MIMEKVRLRHSKENAQIFGPEKDRHYIINLSVSFELGPKSTFPE